MKILALRVTKSYNMVMRCPATIYFLWLMMVTIISFRTKDNDENEMMNLMEMKVTIAYDCCGGIMALVK